MPSGHQLVTNNAKREDVAGAAGQMAAEPFRAGIANCHKREKCAGGTVTGLPLCMFDHLGQTEIENLHLLFRSNKQV